jgi:hypothetical protein
MCSKYSDYARIPDGDNLLRIDDRLAVGFGALGLTNSEPAKHAGGVERAGYRASAGASYRR